MSRIASLGMESASPADVWELLEAGARGRASKLAVVDGDVLQTYGEFQEASCALALALARQGLHRGDRVVVMMRNAWEVMAAHFACAALHLCVVNVNTHLQPAELAHVMNVSDPAVLIAETRFEAQLSSAVAAVQDLHVRLFLWLDLEDRGNSSVPTSAPPSHGHPAEQLAFASFLQSVRADYPNREALCQAVADLRAREGLTSPGAAALSEDGFHLYFTSGTTGLPKAVMLSHRIVVRHALSASLEHRIHEGDVWGHIAPMFHLVDVFAVYTVTFHGGRHAILRSFTAADALALMEREGVTVTNVASTMLTLMVMHPLAIAFDLSSLRLVSCGGSMQSPAVVAAAIALFGCEVFVSYGMTEACGKIAMSLLTDPDDPANVDSPAPGAGDLSLVASSGRPFTDMDIRVIDEQDQDVVPDGVAVGEIVIKGPTVFSGYAGASPEVNASCFTPDGFFRTGDLARVTPEGYLHVVDRAKDMVLVGGENVYSSEVERVLQAHPAVLEAAVVGVPESLMGEQVRAVVVLRPEMRLSPEAPGPMDLLRHCRAQLAPYKVPAGVHFARSLPKTGSGKVKKAEVKVTLQAVLSEERTRRHLRREAAGSSDTPSDWASRLADQVASVVGAGMFHVSATRVPCFLPGMTHVVVSTGPDSATRLAAAAAATRDAHDGLASPALLVLLPASTDPRDPSLISLSAIDVPGSVVAIHASADLSEGAVAYLLTEALASLPPVAYVICDTSSVNTPSQPVAVAQAQAGVPSVTHTKSGAASNGARARVLRVAAEVAKELVGSQINPNASLMDAGIDSSLSVQFAERLSESLGVELPATLAFDHPTLDAIAAYAATLTGDDSAAHGATQTAGAVTGTGTVSPAPSVSDRGTVARVRALVGQVVSEALYGEAVSDDRPLMEAGVDSSSATMLVDRLEDALGLSLPPTLIFDCPTINYIAALVIREAQAQGLALPGTDGVAANTTATAAVPATLPQLTAGLSVGAVPSSHARVVALRALSALLPGGATAADVNAHEDAISKTPFERWDPDDHDMVRFGGYVSAADAFDAAAFGISPVEATLMDPQQRLALIAFAEAWAAVQGRPGPAGVYVGTSQLEYARMTCEARMHAASPYYATGAHLSVASGRIAYAFNLRGPAMTIDTACSSSLVAAACGWAAIQRADVGAAGVLGVNLCLVPSWTFVCHQAGMLSDVGRCKTLDATADGYVRSEAAVAILFCEATGDDAPIVAAVHVNQDGRSSSLTAPSGPAQQDAIRGALRDAPGAAIAALQMHGTGTALGDPIEVSAAMAALRPAAPAGARAAPPLAMTSAKASLGHTEPAAGAVGLATLTRALQDRRQGLPLHHLVALNPYVSAALRSHGRGGAPPSMSAPRTVAPLPVPDSHGVWGSVSAFAFQGTNAHAILHVPDTAVDKAAGPLASAPLAWQRRPWWIWRRASVLGPRALSGSALADRAVVVFCRLSDPSLACMRDHVVLGRALLPGAAMVEASAAACGTALDVFTDIEEPRAIASFVISAPLILRDASHAGQTLLCCTVHPESGIVALSHDASGDAPTTHATGRCAVVGGALHCATTALSASPLAASRPSAPAAPGPVMGAVESLLSAAELVAPALDAALQLGVSGRPPISVLVPVSFGAMRVADCWERDWRSKNEFVSAEESWATWLPRERTGDADASRHVSDLRVMRRGSECSGAGVTTAPMRASARTRAEDRRIAYDILRNVAATPAPSAPHPDRHLCASHGRVTVDAGVGRSRARLQWKGGNCPSALAAAHALLSPHSGTVTDVAVSAPGSTASPVPAPDLGMLQSAMGESLAPTRFFFSPQSPHIDVTSLAPPSRLDIHALHPHATSHSVLAQSALEPPLVGFRLVPQPRGTFDNLRPRLVNTTTALHPWEVEVAVQAVGLNFKDVLNVLSMLDMFKGDPGDPGGDFAGVVMRAGDKAIAMGLIPGSAVFGIASGALADVVRVDTRAVAPVPPHVAMEAAAAVPTVLATVDLALHCSAQMGPADTVLVHAAAGGVGMSTVQAASDMGARVVCTAGSPGKRALLRGRWGARAAVSSRETSFTEALAFSPPTVVLNSLTSPGFVGASLAGMAQGGRFVEIGKRGIHAAQRVARERPDVLYSVVALDFLPPAALGQMLARVSMRLACGSEPLPQVRHAFCDVVAALRQLSQAQHVGKVVVSRSRRLPPLARSFVVIGGTGALGLTVTSHLMQSVPRAHVTLISRSGRWQGVSKQAAASLRRLTRSTGAVTVRGLDASALQGATGFGSGATTAAPIVIHAAGVLEDALCRNVTVASHRRVWASKAAVANAVADTVHVCGTRAVVLFSSVAAVLANRGQAPYVAANLSLDGAAEAMTQSGHAASSVQWGAWEGSGMASDAALQRRLRRLGQGLLSPDQGIRLLQQTLCVLAAPPTAGLAQRDPHTVVANPFDWAVFAESMTDRPMLFSDVTFSSDASDDKTGQASLQHAEGSTFATDAGAHAPSRAAWTRERVDALVAKVFTQVTGETPDPHAPLLSAGMDSLSAVEFVNALSRETHMSLPSTLVFNFPSLAEVAAFIHTTLAEATQQQPDTVQEHNAPMPRVPQPTTPTPPPPRPLGTSEGHVPPIVAIAASGAHLPAVGRGLARAMASGHLPDAIHHVPYSRWDPDQLILATGPDRIRRRFGAYIPDIERFDPSPYGIGASEALNMDPQQRLFLDLCAEMVAGHGLKGTPAGVYNGISWNEYRRLAIYLSPTPIGGCTAQGTSMSVSVGRVAYVFGLTGPAITADTACSSALVAFSLAHTDVLRGRATAALCGGCETQLIPQSGAMFEAAGMLSIEGRCKALDAAADGYVRAEAVAATLLVPLHADRQRSSSATPGQQPSQAHGYTDTRPLLAVTGTAVNQDGRSSGLTAPNGRAQAECMAAALAQGGTLAQDVSTVHLHGTGTALGDPIEIGAIVSTIKGSHQPITAVASKSWLGHSEPASGAVALAQLAAGSLYQSSASTLHLRRVNPYVAEALQGVRSPWRLSRQPLPSASAFLDQTTHAVSAFAFQGTNAHAVLVEAAGHDRKSPTFGEPAAGPRARVWIAPPVLPLVRAPTVTAADVTFLIPRDSDQPALSYLMDHAVSGRALFPGAGLMEVALEAEAALAGSEAGAGAGGGLRALAGIAIPAPLLLAGAEGSAWAVSVTRASGAVRVSSSGPRGTSTNLLASAVQVAGTLAMGSDPLGPSHTALNALVRRQRLATGRALVGALDTRSSGRLQMLLPPELLDSALHLGALFDLAMSGRDAGEKRGQVRVPASAGAILACDVSQPAWVPRQGESLHAWADCKRDGLALIGTYGVGSGEGGGHHDGAKFGTLAALVAKPLAPRATPETQRAAAPVVAPEPAQAGPHRWEALTELQWAVTEPAAETPARGTWTIKGPSPLALFAGVQAAMARVGPGNDLTLFSSATDAGPSRPGSGVAADLGRTALAAMIPGLARTLAAELPDKPLRMAQAGKGRVARADVVVGCHSSHDNASKATAPGATTARSLPTRQSTSHLSDMGAAFAPAVVPAAARPTPPRVALRAEPRGALSNLAAVHTTARDLAPMEVEMAVHAVGINFRDVLNVLDLYEGNAGDPGGDCAGVITRVGAQASSELGLAVGDRVFGLAVGCLGTHAVTDARNLAPVPPHTSLLEAAACPTVFATVDLTLHDAARVTPSDRVLVHAATGGVGMAALAYLQDMGAQVFGTAGSPSKRALLRQQGVMHVASTRDVDFAQVAAFAAPTVILNSLTSPGAIRASLAALARGGRFVEIGKRGVFHPQTLTRDRPDVTPSFVALDYLPPLAVRLVMARVAKALGAGLVPIPQVQHAMRSVVAALRQMSQARHVGKVVVVSARARATAADGCVIITGGTGYLGGLASEWLASRGVRDVVLLGRSGRAAMAGLAGARGRATCVACDTGREEDRAALLPTCERARGTRDRQPMRVWGVLHAAGVLADGLFARMTPASIRSVVAPKLSGLSLVSALSSQHALATTVAFSSVASLLGSAGQTNYAAANAALDSWCSSAHSMGLNATSLQWGPWGGAGMAVSDAAVAARIQRLGFRLITPEAGLAALEATLGASALADPALCAAPLDMPTFLARNPRLQPLFTHGSAIPSTEAPVARLLSTHLPSPVQRAPLPRPQLAASVQRTESADVLRRVRGVASGIIGRDVGDSEPLMAAGLDSLGSAELRSGLESAFGLSLPASLAFDYPTVKDLATFVTSQLPAGGSQPTPNVARRRTTPVAAGVGMQRAFGPTAQRSAEPSTPDMATVQGVVLSAVSGIVGRSVALSEPFMDAGLDSLGASELRSSLEASMRVELPATVVFDYPNAARMAAFLHATLEQRASESAADAWRGEAGPGQHGSTFAYPSTHPSAPHASPGLAAAGAALPSFANVLDGVCALAASIVGRFVSRGEPLMSAGLDSLGTVELRSALEAQFHVRLDPTVAMDYPTPELLAQHVCDLLAHSTENVPRRMTQHPTFAADGEAPGPDAAPAVSYASILATVRELAGTVLGRPVSDTETLAAAGLDSLGAVELRNALESALGVQFPSTLAFDYPTVTAIATLAASMTHVSTDTRPHAPAATPRAPPQIHDAPRLAAVIVDVASKTPGAALTALTMTDPITPVPLSRWDPDTQPVSGQARVPPRFGAFIDQPFAFDAEAFGVNATEAASMDPQHRLVLHVAAAALGQSATGTGLSEGVSRHGVFVGVSQQDHIMVVKRFGLLESSPLAATSASNSVVAGRVSYHLGLKGPCVSCDTACSSSLVALHLAGRACVAQEASGAIAAGVNVIALPEVHTSFNLAGMLAQDGRCKTLDASASGYVRAEGVVAWHVVLWSASAAGTALAALAASSLTQDGRSSSLTAPNGPAQQATLRAALAEAGMPITAVHALHLHGTGTHLGDPIEFNAMWSIIAADRARQTGHPLVIEASKSWTGHGEAAAGAMGVLHGVVGSASRAARGLQHLTTVNPHIQAVMGNAPGSAVDRAAPYFTHLPRQGGPIVTSDDAVVFGVSAFAFQGSNAHVMLRCEPDRAATGLQSPPIVPLAGHWAYPVPTPLSLLTACGGAATSEVVFYMDLGRLPWLMEHCVSGEGIVPGVALAEAACQATVAFTALPDATRTGDWAVSLGIVSAALRLAQEGEGDTEGHALATLVADVDSGEVVIRTQDPRGAATTHFRARMRSVASRVASLSQSQAHGALTRPQDVPSHRSMGVATVALPSLAGSFIHNPAQMDASLHLKAALSSPTAPLRLLVPVGFDAITGSTDGLEVVPRSGAGVRSVCCTSSVVSGVDQCDVAWDVTAGTAGLAVRALQLKPLRSTQPQAAAMQQRTLFETSWEASEPVRQALTSNALWRQARGGRPISTSISGVLEALTTAAVSEHAWIGGKHTDAVSGIQSMTNANNDAAQVGAAWSALCRTALNEMRRPWLTLLDSQPSAVMSTGPIAALEGAEACTATAAGVLTVQRIVPGRSSLVNGQDWHLVASPVGSLSNLRPVPVASRLGPQEVLVKVMAVGINFRDVLSIAGMYPGEAGPPGGDCAGVVVEVGAGVAREGRLRVGEAVMGLAGGCLGSHVVAGAEGLVGMPAGVGFEEAAACPTVLATVELALGRAGGLGAGDRVLVQAAAGGGGAGGGGAGGGGGGDGGVHGGVGGEARAAAGAGGAGGGVVAGRGVCGDAGGAGGDGGAEQPDVAGDGAGGAGGAGAGGSAGGDREAGRGKCGGGGAGPAGRGVLAGGARLSAGGGGAGGDAAGGSAGGAGGGGGGAGGARDGGGGGGAAADVAGVARGEGGGGTGGGEERRCGGGHGWDGERGQCGWRCGGDGGHGVPGGAGGAVAGVAGGVGGAGAGAGGAAGEEREGGGCGGCEGEREGVGGSGGVGGV